MGKEIWLRLKLTFIPCQENKYRPGVFATKFLVYYLIFLFFLKILLLPFFLYFPKSAFFAQVTNRAIIQLTNQKRQLFGLSFLKESPVLDRVAYLKVEDMEKKGYFAHRSPEGISPWHWFRVAGYNYKFAGENLAIGFLDSGELMNAWYNSPSHRENLLNPRYKEMGVAVLNGNFQGNKTTLVVQVFGSPKREIYSSPSPKPAPKVAVAPEKKSKPLSEEVRPRVAGSEKNIKEKKTEQSVREKGAVPVAGLKAGLKGERPEGNKPQRASQGFKFEFVNFLSLKYHRLIEDIIYASLIFVIIYLLIGIFFDVFVYRRFVIDYKDLIPKAIAFSLLLLVFLLIDKQELIKLIPHTIQLY